MARKTNPPQLPKLSQTDLKRLVGERLNDGRDGDDRIPQRVISDVFDALREEVTTCIGEGYRIDVLGIVTLNFGYTTSLPRGKRWNPFKGEEVMMPARKAKLRLTAKAGSRAKNGLPIVASAAGKEVVSVLEAQAEARAKAKRKREREAAKAA